MQNRLGGVAPSDAEVQLSKHVQNSLISINNNVTDKFVPNHLEGYSTQPMDAVSANEKLFKNLEEYYKKSQKQMGDVAKLMDMQLKIDKLIKEKGEPDKTLVNEVKKEYEELKKTQGIGIKDGKHGIEWIKFDKKHKAFKGTLDQYINYKSKIMGVEKERTQDLIKKNFDIKENKGFYSKIWKRITNFQDTPKQKQQFEMVANNINKTSDTKDVKSELMDKKNPLQNSSPVVVKQASTQQEAVNSSNINSPKPFKEVVKNTSRPPMDVPSSPTIKSNKDIIKKTISNPPLRSHAARVSLGKEAESLSKNGYRNK